MCSNNVVLISNGSLLSVSYLNNDINNMKARNWRHVAIGINSMKNTAYGSVPQPVLAFVACGSAGLAGGSRSCGGLQYLCCEGEMWRNIVCIKQYLCVSYVTMAHVVAV